MTICENIMRLTSYALNCGLIKQEDLIYTENRLLELFGLDGFDSPCAPEIPDTDEDELEDILTQMLDYAAGKKLFNDQGNVSRDLFDTRIMGLLVPPPSAVISEFSRLYRNSPQKATDFFYKLSGDSDYIRRYRIKRDVKWQTSTEYGDLDITINLSKPEKDPKAIAAARNAGQGG